MYLLDTCVLSEMVKPRPDAEVLSWLKGQKESDLYLSVLTLGEIAKGIAKLPDGRRKREIEAWVSRDLLGRFQGRLVVIDARVARYWGSLVGGAEKRGKKVSVIDSLVAASAHVHGLTVVTRNVRHMEQCGVPVYCPWRVPGSDPV